MSGFAQNAIRYAALAVMVLSVMVLLANKSVVYAANDCETKRQEARNRNFIGGYVPTCNPDGSFASRQCISSTGKCWCSDKDGKLLSNDINNC